VFEFDKNNSPPAPVIIPHPRGASEFSGKSFPTLTTLRAFTTAYLEKLLCPKKCEETGPSFVE
jgi:hypothetical protein